MLEHVRTIHLVARMGSGPKNDLGLRLPGLTKPVPIEHSLVGQIDKFLARLAFPQLSFFAYLSMMFVLANTSY